jgi:hypothetical protein
VARALRAAQQVGGGWAVVIEDKAIRLIPHATNTGDPVTVAAPAVQEEGPKAEPVVDWKF